MLLSANASAQTGLVAPERVMIYVHRDVQDTDFVEPLVCELSRVLIAPVSAHISDLPIDISMMASMTELDARRVVPAFYQSTTQTTSTRDYAFLIIPYDLQNESTHHTFGTNFGMPYNRGVVSLAFLRPSGSTMSRAEVTTTTVSRTFKVILRYIGHLSGLWHRQGCVLAYPHGVPALDAKPADFCADDRARLVEAQVLKEKPDASCHQLVSSLRRRPRAMAVR